jgi:hypothetical protein
MILKKIYLNRLRNYLKKSTERRNGSSSFRKSRKLLIKSPKVQVRRLKSNIVFLLIIIVLTPSTSVGIKEKVSFLIFYI